MSVQFSTFPNRDEIFVDKRGSILVFAFIAFHKKGVSSNVGGRKRVLFLALVDKERGGVCLATLGN
jgi:hypothetical protein